MSETASALSRPEFPRSNRYDPAWVLEHQMGPNPLWLAEWLCEGLALTPGMRVLDLGCGTALTSVFLAREFGVRVWASDLWIDPDANWRRVGAAGAGELVYPLRAEAHALPFPQGFFDAAVSIDAYHYFGTDDLYLGYWSGFVRPGGVLGVVVPGLVRPFEAGVPAHLAEPQSNGRVFWEDECWSFHTAAWWQELWGRCGKVADVKAGVQPDGWQHWRDFERAVEKTGKSPFPSDAEALDRDQGRYLGFVRITARRTAKEGLNLYDAALGVRFGVGG